MLNIAFSHPQRNLLGMKVDADGTCLGLQFAWSNTSVLPLLPLSLCTTLKEVLRRAEDEICHEKEKTKRMEEINLVIFHFILDISPILIFKSFLISGS